jgi:hypothetical protein
VEANPNESPGSEEWPIPRSAGTGTGVPGERDNQETGKSINQTKNNPSRQKRGSETRQRDPRTRLMPPPRDRRTRGEWQAVSDADNPAAHRAPPNDETNPSRGSHHRLNVKQRNPRQAPDRAFPLTPARPIRTCGQPTSLHPHPPTPDPSLKIFSRLTGRAAASGVYVACTQRWKPSHHT